MASLQVVAANQSVTLDASRTASVNFTVTNSAVAKVSAVLRALASGAAHEGWFTLAGEATQSMEPGESIVLTVRIAVPADAAAGEASLRLRATNENDANNDWADSAGCSFTIQAQAAPSPPPPPPPPPNLALWIALGVLALAVIAGVLYFTNKGHDDPQPPVGPTDVPTTGPTTSPPTTPPVQSKFDEPKIGYYRLDWCRTWQTDCGRPAADAFCTVRGFPGARSFTIDQDIGLAKPTKTLGDARICNQAYCDGFKTIQCGARRFIPVPGPIKTFTFTEAPKS